MAHRYAFNTWVLLFSLFLAACGDGSSALDANDASAVPELLDRSEAIRNGTEWDRVQNMYVSARDAVKNKPVEAQGYIDLARVYVLEARVTGEHGHYYPAAMKVLQDALALPGLTPDEQYQGLTMLASVQLSQHEFAQALQTSQKAIKLNPYAAVGYGAIVDSYVELGMYQEAIEAADKMVQVKPDLRSYARVSYLREIHGKVEGSLEAMRLALDAGVPGTEETAWVRLTLADVLRQYGRTAEAKDQYELALQERPNYPFATAALGQMAAEQGDFQTAERLLDEAISAIPEVGFYEELAHVYRATDRETKAETTVDEVMVMLQEDVESGHNMNLEYANVYINLKGDYDKALEYAEREYEKRPKNIDVNRKLAEIYYLRGDYNKAREHADLASVTGSKKPELQLVDGLIAVAEGNEAHGREMIASAQANYPHPPAALAAALARVDG